MTPTPQPTTVHVAYLDEQPSLDELTVMDSHPGTLFGVPASFLIIGNSHCVSVPGLDYYELCSCVPPTAETTREVQLTDDIADTVSFTTPGITGETRIETRPISEFPGPDTQDMSYQFGPDAYTTISVQSGGYETYHTYPEYDVALYTLTTVEQRRAHQTDAASPATDTPVALPTTDD